MAQLMPLPLTISCSSKPRLILPFWYPLLDKGPLNGHCCCCCCCCDLPVFFWLTYHLWHKCMYVPGRMCTVDFRIIGFNDFNWVIRSQRHSVNWLGLSFFSELLPALVAMDVHYLAGVGMVWRVWGTINGICGAVCDPSYLDGKRSCWSLAGSFRYSFFMLCESPLL